MDSGYPCWGLIIIGVMLRNYHLFHGEDVILLANSVRFRIQGFKDTFNNNGAGLIFQDCHDHNSHFRLSRFQRYSYRHVIRTLGTRNPA